MAICFVRRGGAIDENHGPVDVVVLAGFTESRPGAFVRVGTNGGTQPVLPIVDPGHGFIDRVTRRPVSVRLQVGTVNSFVNCGSNTTGAEYFETTVFESDSPARYN